MTVTRKSGTTRLQWLTVSILLVIAVLAGLGLFSLRQDRRAAEEDARLLAAALSDSLAIECATAVSEALQQYTMRIEGARIAALRVAYGETNDPPELQALPLEMLRTQTRAHVLIRDPERFPPLAATPAPQPPEWLLTAAPEWIEKLETAERTAREGNTAEARRHFNEVAKSNIRPLQSLVRLRLAELGDATPAEVVVELRGVAGNASDDLTPAGLAVADLALLRAVEIAPPEAVGNLIEPILSRAMFHSSFLTERLFSRLEERVRTNGSDLDVRVQAAVTVWNMEQTSRAILNTWLDAHELRSGAFQVQTGPNKFFLFSNGSPYIEANVVKSTDTAVANLVAGNHWIAAIIPDSIVDQAVRRASSDIAPRWPRYLSAEVELAGHRFGVTPWDQGRTHAWDWSPALVTNTASFHTVAGTHPVAVKVWLANPDLLHSTRTARAMIFALLIIGASAIAVFGAWQLQKNLNAQIRLNEQKSNFVSSVSHELRAPIASVRLMAEGLERGKVQDPRKQAEYFQFIGQECRRLSSLIENVLDFSRIEQGRKQYEFEPTDVLALTRETVKLMEPYATERNVRLALETSDIQHPTSNIELVADGRALQQALINLIDNAIKHSPKGETITVRLEHQQPEAGGRKPVPLSPQRGEGPGVRGGSVHDSQPSTLRLHISDHGPGIPPEEHEKIFERFHRLGSELRRETQGVGIGLSIVKHIVEAHGGRVTVHSTPGHGSRFTIELPMRNNHE